jgi:hypothetical protein
VGVALKKVPSTVLLLPDLVKRRWRINAILCAVKPLTPVVFERYGLLIFLIFAIGFSDVASAQISGVLNFSGSSGVIIVAGGSTGTFSAVGGTSGTINDSGLTLSAVPNIVFTTTSVIGSAAIPLPCGQVVCWSASQSSIGTVVDNQQPANQFSYQMVITVQFAPDFAPTRLLAVCLINLHVPR